MGEFLKARQLYFEKWANKAFSNPYLKEKLLNTFGVEVGIEKPQLIIE